MEYSQKCFRRFAKDLVQECSRIRYWVLTFCLLTSSVVEGVPLTTMKPTNQLNELTRFRRARTERSPSAGYKYWERPCGQVIVARTDAYDTKNFVPAINAAMRSALQAEQVENLLVKRWDPDFPGSVVGQTMDHIPQTPEDVDDAYLDAVAMQFAIEHPRLFESLQIFAVNFEQIYRDEDRSRGSDNYAEAYGKLKDKMKELMCYMEMNIAAMGHRKRQPVVTADFMPQEVRDMQGAEQDYRDYITIRDYRKMLIYISATYGRMQEINYF